MNIHEIVTSEDFKQYCDEYCKSKKENNFPLENLFTVGIPKDKMTMFIASSNSGISIIEKYLKEKYLIIDLENEK